MTEDYCRYLVKYHLVWCPKPKAENFYGSAGESLKDILLAICAKYRYEIHSLEVSNKFIHVFLSVDPYVAPADVIRTLKSISAVRLFQQFPEMRAFYGRQGSLWEKGYLVSTGDTLDSKLLKQFLDDLLF